MPNINILPDITYDSFFNRLTIHTSKSEYENIKNANHSEFFSSLKLLFLEGLHERTVCKTILSQIEENNEFDINKCFNEPQDTTLRVFRLLQRNYISSSYPIPTRLDKFNANKLKHLCITPKGTELLKYLNHNEDNNIPDINTNPNLYDQVISKKTFELLTEAESKLTV